MGFLALWQLAACVRTTSQSGHQFGVGHVVDKVENHLPFLELTTVFVLSRAMRRGLDRPDIIMCTIKRIPRI